MTKATIYSRSSTRVLLTLTLLLLVLSSTATADERAIRADLKADAANLLDHGDVAAYVERATALRTTRERTPAGIWKLSLFYRGPDKWPSTQPDAPVWNHIEAATLAYLHDHPDSPSAIIAHARILESHAWTCRGSGLGSDLTADQRSGFEKYLERARAVLDQYREVGSRDPEWYAMRLRVMNGQDDDKSTILALAQEALDLEPSYQPIDYAAANALLPKWGGSPELLQQFVALAIAKGSSADGTQAYARIMFDIARSDPKPVALLKRVGVQWPALRASLAEIVASYPDPWNENTQRAMACLVGTQAEYDAAVARIGPNPTAVAWFDSESSWPECLRRQQRAAQPAFAGWLQALISTPPSADFAVTAAAGVALTVGLLYGTRRRRLGDPVAAEEFHPPLPLGGDFPTVYRITPAWCIGILLLAGIMGLGSLIGAWEIGVMLRETRGTPQGLALVFFLSVLASGAVLYAVDTLTSSLALYANRLEIREMWRVRRVMRATIESRQILRPSNSSAVLVLRLKSPGNRKIKLPILWKPDATWDDWFSGIPDVDAEASKAFVQEIESNIDLGATPEERQAKLRNARSLAKVAIWANLGLFVWSLWYPHPYDLLIFVLAVLPWAILGFMARSPGLYAFNARPGSGRPDLTVLVISPGFMLALRALQDVHVLDWRPQLIWALIGAVVLSTAVWWAIPQSREKLGTLVLTLLLFVAYGYGASALANVILDRSAGSTYPTTIYGKHITSGRNRTPTLQLGPWGPRAAVGDVNVSWDMYRSESIGDKVCVHLHTGALRIPWYGVTPCPPG